MKNLKENFAERMWNIITYIICGTMVLTGVVIGVGTAVVAYPTAGVAISVVLGLGIPACSLIFAFTVLSISKALYNWIFYHGIYKDYKRRKY